MNASLPHPDPIARLPIAILMLRTNCNCRCVMCDIWRDRTRRELPVEALRDLLPQFERLGTAEIVLSGGEPLMHTEIETLCRMIATRGIGVTLLTTGLLLRRNAAWIAECVRQVIVSLDGPQEIHDAIRNVQGGYAKIRAGIVALRRLSATLDIRARCTVQRQNFRFLPATVAAARELGTNGISFLAADVQPASFGRGVGWSEHGLALQPVELPELERVLCEMETACAADFASSFIAESAEKLRRRILDYYRALAGEGELPPVRCNAPWVSTVIDVDGRVRPCFFHRPLPGNATEQPIGSILNSDAARAWRQSLDVTTDPVCRRCVCSLAFDRG